MIIAPTVFRDEEYAEPKVVLEVARRTQVTTASVEPGECTGRFGLKATGDDLGRRGAADAQWDAVVFVGGGGGARCSSTIPRRTQLARTQAKRGGSACGNLHRAFDARPTLACSTGVRVTAFPSREDDLKAHGAQWTGAPVTVDGFIITANGPEAATEFGEAIASALGV